MAHRQNHRADVLPAEHLPQGPLARWRLWGPLLLMVGFVGWRVLDQVFASIPGHTWQSPGPLATVHSTWDAACEACHPAFTPISADNWAGKIVGNVKASNHKCIECHQGPGHHSKEKLAEAEACTACHRDHFGQTANLLAVADQQCTRCHRDLKGHLATADTKTEFGDVSTFAKPGHPEFKMPSADPGKLKFNHALHLAPGLRRTPEGEPFTLERLDQAYQDAYRTTATGDADASVIQLQCASCHQLDGQENAMPPSALHATPINALTPARAAGATFQPIVYEKHCQACHPLSFERTDPSDPTSGRLTVRHRLKIEEIRQRLQDHYVSQQGLPTKHALAPVPLPGKKPADQPAVDEAIKAKINRAAHDLLLSKRGCGECHFLNADVNTIDPLNWESLRVQPTEVPQVWFTHAKFNHLPHRAVECKACHENVDKSTKQTDVLLPKMETCMKCHAPRHGVLGGARHDCAECHRYHDADHPLSGIGARARSAKSGVDIETFLRGRASN